MAKRKKYGSGDLVWSGSGPTRPDWYWMRKAGARDPDEWWIDYVQEENIGRQEWDYPPESGSRPQPFSTMEFAGPIPRPVGVARG